MVFINKYWSVAGALSGIVILLMVFFNIFDLSPLSSFILIQLSFLIFHQFEEYTYPGGFKKFFNVNFEHLFVKYGISLNDTGILLINVVFGWTFFLICAFVADTYSWLSAGAVLILFINGVLHAVMWIIRRSYNPGLITGVFLFIPSGIFLMIYFPDSGNPSFFIKAIITAVTGTLIIPVTIVATSVFRKQHS